MNLPYRENGTRLWAMPRLARALLGASIAVGLVIALGSVAGCATAAEAGGSFGSGRLASDVAARLIAANASTYTAAYTLAGDAGATIAHEQVPIRIAYVYPKGRLLLAPDRTVQCLAQPHGVPQRCAITMAVARNAPLPTVLDIAIEKSGLIRPDTVATLLTQASRNADAIISEHDTTVAGTNATCVSITGVPVANQFSTCVTSDGLLASFTGTRDGRPIDITLNRFTMATAAGVFDPPKGATITDAEPS